MPTANPKPWTSWPSHERKFIRFNGGNPLICCTVCNAGLTTASSLRQHRELIVSGVDEFDTPNRWYCAKHVPETIAVEPRVKTWGWYWTPDGVPPLCFRESVPARKPPLPETDTLDEGEGGATAAGTDA